jgi:hypothetical protein
VHRIATLPEKAQEEKQVCSSIFSAVAQAFEKVWNEGLCHKIELLLPPEFGKLLQSYLSDRYSRVKQEDKYSRVKLIKGWSAAGKRARPGLVPNIYERSPASRGNYGGDFC